MYSGVQEAPLNVANRTCAESMTVPVVSITFAKFSRRVVTNPEQTMVAMTKQTRR